MSFSLVNTTKEYVPQIDFKAIKEAVLGSEYALSLVISDAAELKKLNLIYRNKNNPTDILSFPLSDSEGEIYMCPEEVRSEMKRFDRNYENFFAFLFIHGCAHLKGHDHSDRMEEFESTIRSQFHI